MRPGAEAFAAVAVPTGAATLAALAAALLSLAEDPGFAGADVAINN